MTRNKEIITKYKTGNYTYEQLGEEYSLTGERIRQIINPLDYSKCQIHNHKYLTEEGCQLCVIDQIYNTEISMVELMEVIERLKTPDRTKATVYERKKVIDYLTNKFKLTPGFIGNLMKRDITTIKHHLGIK